MNKTKLTAQNWIPTKYDERLEINSSSEFSTRKPQENCTKRIVSLVWPSSIPLILELID